MRPLPFVIGETYLDRQGEYVVTDVQGDEIRFKRPDGSEQTADATLKARIHNNVLANVNGPLLPKGINRHGINARPAQSGILEQMFWCIAEIIEAYSNTTTDYMAHDSLADALVQHSYAGPLLKQRSGADSERKSPSWFASDYVAFYSREWTLGRPRHAERFERKKIDGNWAYRVRQ